MGSALQSSIFLSRAVQVAGSRVRLPDTEHVFRGVGHDRHPGCPGHRRLGTDDRTAQALNPRHCFVERGHVNEQHPAVQVWNRPVGEPAIQCRALPGAGLNPPVIDARHLLDLPAQRLAVKVSQCGWLLAVDFKMCD